MKWATPNDGRYEPTRVFSCAAIAASQPKVGLQHLAAAMLIGMKRDIHEQGFLRSKARLATVFVRRTSDNGSCGSARDA